MEFRKRVKKGWIVCCCLLLLLPGSAMAKRYRSGDESVPKIAITMDDCFRSDYVEAMLALCREYDFQMTFFPCGVSLHEEDKAMWQSMIEEGHEIGNHTVYHNDLSTRGQHQIDVALGGMQKRLDALLGYHYAMTLMRPPYGALKENSTQKMIQNAGYEHIILWNVATTNVDEVMQKTKNGCILIFHATMKDLDCLEVVIPQLIEKGFELVTVTELLGLDPVVISPLE